MLSHKLIVLTLAIFILPNFLYINTSLAQEEKESVVDAVFSVEFDSRFHREKVQEKRDDTKNWLCRRFGLPLLRINSNYLLRKYRNMDLLSWFVEIWFLEKGFYEAQEKGLVANDESFDPFTIYYMALANFAILSFQSHRRGQSNRHRAFLGIAQRNLTVRSVDGHLEIHDLSIGCVVEPVGPRIRADHLAGFSHPLIRGLNNTHIRPRADFQKFVVDNFAGTPAITPKVLPVHFTVREP